MKFVTGWLVGWNAFEDGIALVLMDEILAMPQAMLLYWEGREDGC